jgi:DNA-binding NarL/FixJ family response regulator
LNILVLEDEPLVAHAIVRRARGVDDAYVAATVCAGNLLLAKLQNWGAFILDVRLPDGSGLDVLVNAIKANPRTPALILSGFNDPEFINAAFDLSARYLAKSFFKPARIERFLREASNLDSPVQDPVKAQISAWTERYGLSSGEADVLLKAAEGASREEIAELRGSSALTVKSQEKRLCEKTGDLLIRDAVARLLREAARNAHRH